MVFDPNSPDASRPVATLTQDGLGVGAVINRHRPLFALLLVVTAQILLLSLQIIRNHHVRLIRYWAVQAFDPFERSLGGLINVSSTAYKSYRHLWTAEQENQELRLQLVAAQAQVQRLGQEAGEAEHLRTLLGFKNQLGFQTVSAEVIASSPGENSNAIFIDKGSDSGLTNDLAVIIPEGVVGKIVAIFPHSAQVLLITDPSSGVGVSLAQSGVQGILKGGINNFCDLHYVMNDEAVNSGEQVVTSGLDQVYPKGLPVGTVVTVGNGNIYKTINVKPSVDLNRLEMVLVVLKPAAAEQQAMNGPR
ncbi:MAG: rod shape-determining protein MreC [Terriglobia bacterium]